MEANLLLTVGLIFILIVHVLSGFFVFSIKSYTTNEVAKITKIFWLLSTLGVGMFLVGMSV